LEIASLVEALCNAQSPLAAVDLASIDVLSSICFCCWFVHGLTPQTTDVFREVILSIGAAARKLHNVREAIAMRESPFLEVEH
jgi:hypothetical protein